MQARSSTTANDQNDFLTIMKPFHRQAKGRLSVPFQIDVQPGFEFFGPDGKKSNQDNTPNDGHYIVWEISNSVIAPGRPPKRISWHERTSEKIGKIGAVKCGRGFALVNPPTPYYLLLDFRLNRCV